MGAAEPACCPQHGAGGGDELEGGGIHRYKGDHGIAGAVLMGIQLLQLPHGGKAQGSGGIAQTQQIGGKIHADGLHSGAAPAAPWGTATG